MRRILSALLLASAPLLAQEPAGGPQPPPNDFDRYFFQVQVLRAIEGKASVLMEQGKADAAIEELKRAQTVDVPKDHPAFEAKVHLLGQLAIAMTNVGKKKEAVETIQRLLQDVPAGTPAEAAAWLDAGVVYKQAGLPEEALKAFDKAIELSEKLARSGRRPGPFPPGRPGGPRGGPGGRPPGPPGGPPGGPPSVPPKGDRK